MKILYILGLFCSITIFSQANNPIIFGDIGIGYVKSISKGGGLIRYGSIYYQNKTNLFSLRYSEYNQFQVSVAPISFIGLPLLENNININEFAVLYGKRYINDNFSYSFSGGLSTNNFKKLNINTETNHANWESKQQIGFPLELSIKWFKSKKSPYRIYEIIPVGKPTSLGNSIGFKLIGNISKYSYLGVGLDFGIGYHKEY